MLYTIKTKTSIDSIKNDMASRAKEQGFGVLKEYHFQELLQSKGYPIEQDITVFEVCNPIAAQNILKTYPQVAVFLPCRISLYEQDGTTILSTLEVDDIINNFDLDSEIKTHMIEVFDTVKNILNTWK